MRAIPLRFVALSLGLHALALGLAARTRRPAPVDVELQFLNPPVELARSPAKSNDRTPPTASNYQTEPKYASSTTKKKHDRANPIPPRPLPEEKFSASTLNETRPAAPIDLLPEAALRGALPAARAPGWGGTTRRAGDGRPPPGQRDREADGAEASARIGGWLRDIAGEERARANVPPAWREVERQIDAGFHPTAAAITDDARVVTLGRQLLAARPTGGPTPRGADPSVETGRDHLAEYRTAQIAACQRAFDEPTGWRRTEVVVTVGADGRLVDARVTSPSGRAALDRHALDAVRRAVALRPIRDPCAGRAPGCTVAVRFAVEAAVQVNVPQLTPLVDPVSGKAQGAMLPLNIFFDEALHKFEIEYPLKQHVRTRVALIAIEE